MIEQIFAKIILHRIISAVWLTDFLSEIRSLINPRWWGEHLVLSVKRCSCLVLYWYRTHWWSLASCLVLGAEGGVAVWVVQDVLMLGFIPLNVMIDIFLILTRIHISAGLNKSIDSQTSRTYWSFSRVSSRKLSSCLSNLDHELFQQTRAIVSVVDETMGVTK